jgi:ATP-binding cassette subfamily F protein 3
MISLKDISKQFGEQSLFRELSLHIGDGERVALVGPNGAGKSTLMKIIIGEFEADTGSITQSRFTTTGYLPQDGVYHTGRTLLDEVARAFDDLHQLNARLTELSQDITCATEEHGAGSPELAALLDELGNTQDAIEHQHGYSIEARIKQILSGLGFSEKDGQRMTEEFSGGWQMRIEIAKLLLQEPKYLLLDEPTNHLDIESLEWLENYLKSYRGGLILVSHDSRFLNNLVTRVVEISRGTATSYTGNFTSYQAQKAVRQDQQTAAFEQQQKVIEKTSRFIERFRSKNTKAKQVQSRVKMLDKMERIEIDRDHGTIAFDFPEAPRPGKILMELADVTKAYGPTRVFDGISFQITKGERIALLGVNGSGKSTLARIIAGSEPFQGGERKVGHNVVLSYYAQNMAETLDLNKTVLQTVQDASTAGTPGQVRSLLGCFLFTGDDAFKPVSVLSGGEKSRLAIAKMLLTPANLMIFDEPTNHLDAQSKAILQQSLLNFSGNYVIVSHDRDFIAPLINRVIYLNEGGFVSYPGTVDDFMDTLKREHEDAGKPREDAKTNASHSLEKERKRQEAQSRQQLSAALKPLREARDRLEADINRIEERKTEIETAFADQHTYEDDKLVQSLHIEHDRLQSQLDDLYDQWTAIEADIETITAAS